MRITAGLISMLIFAGHTSIAWASDACSTTAIRTSADVTVSDGSEFRTESFFHSREAAAIRHISDSDQVIAVEGPLSWVRVGDESETSSDFHKLFALGHQYHAFLLHFDQIVGEARTTEQVSFGGNAYRARSGNYPYGGTVHLVYSGDPNRPAGLLFEFPEMPAIEVTFSEWKKVGGIDLPYFASIDDGERVFDYHYTSVAIEPDSPLWFHAAVAAPELDELLVYRLHRKLLAAHCLGDAGMMAGRSTEQIVSVNNGNLTRATRDSTLERFSNVFEVVDYTGYYDIKLPVIEVAESSDIGWIAVNVRAVGSDIESGEPFDDQWAWLMTVRKVDGQWLHAGNASNYVR